MPGIDNVHHGLGGGAGKIDGSGRPRWERGVAASRGTRPVPYANRDVAVDALEKLAHRGFDWVGPLGLGGRVKGAWLAAQQANASSDSGTS